MTQQPEKLQCKESWGFQLAALFCSAFFAHGAVELINASFFKLETPSQPGAGFVPMLMFAVNIVTWMDAPVRDKMLRELIWATVALLSGVFISVVGIGIAMKTGFPAWIAAVPGTTFALWFILPFRRKVAALYKSQSHPNSISVEDEIPRKATESN